MRAFFLGILCLAAFRAPAAETLSGLCRFGAEELQAGTALRNMERESGKWLPSPWPCRVAEEGGITTVWKGHRSRYRCRKAQAGSWRLSFLVCVQTEAAGEVAVTTMAGEKALPGVSIGATGTIAGFDGRTPVRPVPSDQFKLPVGKWTPVWIEFHAGEEPSYSLGSSKNVLLQRVPLAAEVPQFIDGVEIRACTSGDGGRKILLDQFELVPLAGTLPQAAVRLEPLNGNLGFCFVSGSAVRFRLQLSGCVPDSGMTAGWSVSPYYQAGTVKASDMFIPDSTGGAVIQLPDDLPKQSYRLRLFLKQNDRKLLEKEYSFAVLSPSPEPAEEPENEFLGMCTMEMHPSSETFEKDLAILKLLGVQHIRVWSPWSWYHPEEDREPVLAEKRKAADRFAQEGIRWIEDIQAAPAWASDAPADGINRWKYPPRNWDFYAKYINALTAALGSRASYQIWCEPASWMSIDRIEGKYPGGIAEVISRYMLLTEAAVKRNAPGAVFMGPASSSGVPEWTAILLRRYGTHFNAISYHYPKWPNTPRSTNQRIRRDILRYADRLLPQYCDEAESFAMASPEGEERQLAALQFAVEQWGEGICRRFYHCLFRHPRVPDGPDSNYLTADFQPSGGIGVFQTLLAQTRNADYIGKREFPGGAVLHFYRRENRLCAIAWKNGMGNGTPAVFWNDETKIFDRYGNLLENGTFQLGREVVYLENPVNGIGGELFMQLRPETLRLDADLVQPVRLTFFNPSNAPVSGKVCFNDEFAEIKPEETILKLEPGERREQVFTVRPRRGQCDFRRRSITAEWNGRKIIIGHGQYFDPAKLLTVDAGGFSAASGCWEQTPGEFRHEALAGAAVPSAHSGFRAVRKKDGRSCGEFRAVFAPRPEAEWLGMFFARQPLVLPGIPVTMRLKYRADTEMLPSGAGVLFRFEDARGKIFQYGVVPFLSASDSGELLMRESFLDSPVTQAHRHSQWGGGDPESITYPIRFLGFSLNPTPQRLRNAVWDGRIEVEAIEFDCYMPQEPPRPVLQQQDATNHF